MKKYKLVIFMASLVLIVAVLAGCTSSNPVAEELAKQRAALIIGEFDEIHTITVNGTEINPDEDGNWKDLFEVGSEVRLVVDPAPGWEFLGWDFDENANELETTIVMFDDNTRITPTFNDGLVDVGAEGLDMEMETQPGNTVVGENIEGPPAVIISNNQGPVEGVEVTVSIESDLDLDGTMVQTTDENGIATFDDLVIDQVGEGYVLVFEAEFADIPLRVDSEAFDVVEEELDVYTLTMEEPKGEGTVTPDVGDHEFNDGTVVELKAVPSRGEFDGVFASNEDQGNVESNEIRIPMWRFSHWEGDVENRESAETTITMDADKTVRAIFVEDEEIVDPETFDVTFVVVDGDGNPIAGAEVELGPLTPQTTGEDGKTVFANVPAQEWGYTVTAAGFDDATGTVDVDEDKTVTVNMVTEAYDVTFEVVDGDNNPIDGAEVELGPLTPQTTGEDGKTVFANVPAQEWGYTVTAAGFDDATGTVDVDEDKTVTVNMVTEAYDVTFEVVDGDNNPIDGAEVELGPLTPQTTGEDGKTVFANVPAQEWGYTVTAAGFDDATGTVDVDEDKTVTVNMVTEAYDVTFEVVDGDNNPIDGAEVELGPLPSQTTDADGETVFEDVPAQEWGYTVTAAGFDDATGTVDVDEDKTVTVNMVTEAYDVTFEVVDGDGNPITGAEVELGPLPSQTTDADGETVFEDVPAQEWGYTVTAAGFDDATGTVDVDEDKTVTVNMVEEGKVVPIIDKSDVFVSPGNDTITFNVRDTSGNRVEGLDDKDEWKVELTVDGNSSIVWVLYAEDSVSGYPLQGGLDFQIRVEDIPKGTALRQVKVTYMGYDEDVIVVDGMSLDE